jgi:hypothetical protein
MIDARDKLKEQLGQYGMLVKELAMKKSELKR